MVGTKDPLDQGLADDAFDDEDTTEADHPSLSLSLPLSLSLVEVAIPRDGDGPPSSIVYDTIKAIFGHGKRKEALLVQS